MQNTWLYDCLSVNFFAPFICTTALRIPLKFCVQGSYQKDLFVYESDVIKTAHETQILLLSISLNVVQYKRNVSFSTDAQKTNISQKKWDKQCILVSEVIYRNPSQAVKVMMLKSTAAGKTK
jgi:hypothetical protein